jgi:hypothetical protein
MPGRLDEHSRKHLALWIAVGGTMAVIIALWVLILPMQLADMKFSGVGDAARWYTTQVDATGGPQPTFSEVLAQQRRDLEEIERQTTTESSGNSSAKIEELRAKIEASNDVNVAPAPAPSPAPSNPQ